MCGDYRGREFFEIFVFLLLAWEIAKGERGHTSKRREMCRDRWKDGMGGGLYWFIYTPTFTVS